MAIPGDERLPFLKLGTDPQSVRHRVEMLERVLERMIVIPGLKRPVGLDVMLDFIPGVGPTVAAGLGAYLAWEARNCGLPKWHMARMAGNVGVDWMFGMIPFVGAIPDYFFRSNTRNLRIIKRHLDKHHASTALVDGEVSRQPGAAAPAQPRSAGQPGPTGRPSILPDGE